MLELGLLRYVAWTPLAREITILHEPRLQRPAAAQPEDDPWNLWVFRSRVNAIINTQELRTGKFVSASLSGNRTTEEWKINVGLNGAYADTEFELGGGDRFRNVTRNFDLTSLVVRSLGDHWAWAVGGSATASTFVNQDLTFRFAPAIQYNFFPFAESTRRQFTISYAVGATAFDYEEETIFGETEEVLLDQTLTVSLDLNEPWGSSDVALEVSSFLEDSSKNRVVFFGDINFRVFRGLALNVSGNASRIRDQVFLSGAGLTPEDILVDRRQLKTDFRLGLSVGVSITFGSIYNNVANSRFAGSSGGIIRAF